MMQVLKVCNDVNSWQTAIEPTLDNGFDTQWLIKPYNVTSALEDVYGNIELELICQQFNELSAEEKTYLGFEKCFVREIYLKHDKEFLTYGRVIFSTHAFAKLEDEIMQLGTKPIGRHILYKNNYIRSTFEYKKLNYEDDPLLSLACANLGDSKKPNFAYARRSMFSPPDDIKSTISLQEVFFPWLRKYEL